ncbi:MAG: hypothetical protein H6745_30130 [Deltaproteobacteria bacterium]|nr:hypothetical protein [Deltaproteobacteria bacterium]
MRTIHIEKKTLTAEASAATARRALAQHARVGQWLTAADVAQASGLPLADAGAALLDLSALHPCRVGVAEDGRLAVRFESLATDPERGRLARARAWLRAHRDQVLAAFTVGVLPLFLVAVMIGAFSLMYGLEVTPPPVEGAPKVLLQVLGSVAALACLAALIAIFYVAFMTYVGVLLIASPIAVITAPSWETGAREWGLGQHVGMVVVSVLVFVPLGVVLLKRLREAWARVFSGESARWAPTFWRAVGGFAFGPATPRVDALEDERRLVALIRERRGVVTTADLMGLFGWLPERADSEIVRVMLDYGGDVAVTEEGELLWIFPELGAGGPAALELVDGAGGGELVALVPAATAAPDDAASRPVFRAGFPPRARFFGCGPAVWAGALVLLLPVLLGPVVHPHLIAFPGPAEVFAWHGPAASADPGMQALGAWPAVLVLALLALRVPGWVARGAAARRARRELTLLRAACDAPDGAWVTLAPGDDALVARLEGDVVAQRQDGASRIAFPRVARALAAAARERGWDRDSDELSKLANQL